MTDDKIIDLEAMKDRRTLGEIDADEARWSGVYRQLSDVMASSGLSDTALASVTLRALLGMLGTGMSRHTAKERIARSLKAFQE